MYPTAMAALSRHPLVSWAFTELLLVTDLFVELLFVWQPFSRIGLKMKWVPRRMRDPKLLKWVLGQVWTLWGELCATRATGW